MKDYSPKSGNNQEEPEESILNGIENINSLEELAKHGARIILGLALKNEIDEYIEKTKPLRDGEGRRLVYRNGYHREREIQTEWIAGSRKRNSAVRYHLPSRNI